LDAFEKKGLFQLTRLLALAMVFLLFAGAMLGVVAAYKFWPKSDSAEVPASEVLERINPRVSPSPVTPEARNDSDHAPAEPDGLSGLIIPKSLEAYLSTINSQPGYENILVDPDSRARYRQLLADRMESLSIASQAEKQAYLDELGSAVSAASAQKIDVGSAIDNYMDIKQEKVTRYQARLAEAKGLRLWAAGTVVSVLFLIAMFSVVLVLLAIERNTRIIQADTC